MLVFKQQQDPDMQNSSVIALLSAFLARLPTAAKAPVALGGPSSRSVAIRHFRFWFLAAERDLILPKNPTHYREWCCLTAHGSLRKKYSCEVREKWWYQWQKCNIYIFFCYFFKANK